MQFLPLHGKALSYYKILIFTALFSIAFFLFFKQALNNTIGLYPSDIQSHINFARDFSNGNLHSLAHPGFHILSLAVASVFGMSLQKASSLVMAILVVVNTFLTYLIVKKLLVNNNYSDESMIGIALILNFLTAIYNPFSGNFYLGQGSPNVWHNPTMTAVKPFALISIVGIIEVLNRDKVNMGVLWIGLVLIISAIMKPSFLIVFIPGLLLFVLLHKFRYKNIFMAHCKINLN